MINQNIENVLLNPYNTGFRADAPKNNYAGTLPVNIPTAVDEGDIELPDMYYMPENYKKEKGVLDTVKKFDLFGIIKAWTEHPLLMVGTCAGMSLAIDAFDKSCEKEYEKSIVGKAAKLGDNIEQSNAIKNETSQKALKGIKKVWNKTKNFAMKNDVIYSMFKTPSQPEWSAPKDELKHTNYRIVNKFKELVSLMDMMPAERGAGQAVRKSFAIKDLALDKNEIDELKKIYNVEKLSEAPKEEIPYRVILKRIGKSEQEISEILSGSNVSESVADELFKKSGLTREEMYAIMHDDSGETIELVKKASKNLRGTKINNGKIVLPGSRQPFANVEGFENIYNRAYSLTDGAKTKTGRFMSKLVQKIHRAFTWGNQKTGVMLLVAPMFMEVILNTHKAEKDEKVGTAVSGLFNAVSWVFTFPIALRMIHAYGGIQYAGMGKEKVETYRKLVNEFNEKVSTNAFKDINEYRTAKKALKKQLKNLRSVKNQNLLTETLRGISKFSKADLLKIESFKGGSATANFLRKLPNLIKDYVIYAPGRILIFMLVGVSLVDKIINKILSKIFGTAYDGMKDDEMEEAKEKQEEYTINNLRTRLVEIEKDKLNPSKSVELKNAVNNSSIKQRTPESMLELAMLNEKNVNNEISENANAENIEPEYAAEIHNNTQDKPIAEDNITDIANNELRQENNEQQAVIEPKQEEPPVPEVIAPANLLPAAVNETETNVPEHITANMAEPENIIPTPVNEIMPENTEPIAANVLEPKNQRIMPLPLAKNIEELPFAPAKTVKNYDNYTYIPSSENILNKETPAMATNKYIPSQVGIKINKFFDNSALEAAIRRSNRAEQRALKILAGNFDNIG